MRLYNANSRTPLEPTGRRSPLKSVFSQNVRPFMRKWSPRKRKPGAVDSSKPSKVLDKSSVREATKLTSACFDPFELDDRDDSVEFPSSRNSFLEKNGTSPSDETSVTEKLTPIMSAESHDLFAVSAEADEFVTFPEFPTTHPIDFQSAVQGDLFNDTGTWMSTTSTLSTKFTNHEMGVTKSSKRVRPRVHARALWSSPPPESFFKTHRGDESLEFLPSDGQHPDEVFVRTPQPHFDLDEDTFSAFGAAISSQQQPDVSWCVDDSKENVAFDPFTTGQGRTTDLSNNTSGQREFQGNTRGEKQGSSPGDMFVSVKANLRRVPRSSSRPLKASTSNNQSALPLVRRGFNDKIISLPPAKTTDFAVPVRGTGPQMKPTHSVPSGSDAVELASFTEKPTQDNLYPTAQPVSQRVTTAFPSTNGRQIFPSSGDSTHSETSLCMNAGDKKLLDRFRHVPAETASEEVNIPHPVEEEARAAIQAALRDLKRTAEPSSKRVEVSSNLKDFILSATSKNVPPTAQNGPSDTVNLQSNAGPSGRSPQRTKPIGTKSPPLATRIKELTHGRSVKEVLNLRFGKRMAAKSSVEENEDKGEPVDGARAANDQEPEPQLQEGVPLKDDPQYAKYFKMLKLGLPMGAVKNAMQRDGMDPSIMDGDHSAPAPTKNEPPSGGTPLKDDSKYAKYFMMLKLGLPMGAVKNAMMRDGVDPGVMDGDHSAPASGGKDGQDEAHTGSMVPKDKFRRTRLHWKTHDIVRSNTVWAMVKRDPDVSGLQVDDSEFTRLFQIEAKPIVAPGPTTISEQDVVKVIDKKRANNGGIALARIKLTNEEIAAAVNSYDEAALSQEQIGGVMQYLPTSEETKALRNYLGGQGSSTDGLCECEKFMVAMMNVKHAKRKLHAILYIQKFASSLEELRRDARLIQMACDEIMSSSRFRKVLGSILNVGNRLNTAGPGKKSSANAFTLDSLAKLTQVKAFDKKTTFLQYVVCLVRRNNATLVHFKDDMPTVFVADKILWEQTLVELNRMESQLENVRRLALHRGRENAPAPTAAHASVAGDSVTAFSIPKLTLTVQEEIALLQQTGIGKFTLDACEDLAAVVEEIERAKVSYNALLLYFGEKESQEKMQPHEVFQIIATFSKDFDAAVTAVVENEKEQIREAKRQARRKCPPTTSPADSDESIESIPSQGSLRKRLSAGMGGVLNELRCKPTTKVRWKRRNHV